MLAKPGIVYGNAIHFIAGFLLGSRGGVDILAGVYGLIGTALLIASACVINNYFDRDIDARMKRTSKRASVTGVIPVQYGSIYASILGLLGVGILIISQQGLVLLLGLVAHVLYTTVYTYSKRVTPYSTAIGSVPGAIPALAGYVVMTQQLSFHAWLVFLLIVAWQMPHFYAISLYRKKEYQAAKLPVVGVLLPVAVVIRKMIVWTILYCFIILLLMLYGVYGYITGGILLVGAIYWLQLIGSGREQKTHEKWAKDVFNHSLVLSLLFLATASLHLVIIF